MSSAVAPGGVVEADESPRDAAQREIAEELGLDCTAGRLLVLDWVTPAAGKPEIGSVLTPVLARRMTAAVHACRDNTTAYLEDGYLIT